MEKSHQDIVERVKEILQKQPKKKGDGTNETRSYLNKSKN